MAIFHSVRVWCDSVLFCLGRYRIRTLVNFFSSGLFFGLPVFRGSVLRNLQGCFDILSSFWGGYSVQFLAICRAVLIYLVQFSGLFKGLSLFSDSVDFSSSKCSYFLIFTGLFRGSSSTALFFFLAFFRALREWCIACVHLALWTRYVCVEILMYNVSLAHSCLYVYINIWYCL